MTFTGIEAHRLSSQRVSLFGDRTLKVTVFNRPPYGGMSNSVSLRVSGKGKAASNFE